MKRSAAAALVSKKTKPVSNSQDSNSSLNMAFGSARIKSQSSQSSNGSDSTYVEEEVVVAKKAKCAPPPAVKETVKEAKETYQTHLNLRALTALYNEEREKCDDSSEEDINNEVVLRQTFLDHLKSYDHKLLRRVISKCITERKKQPRTLNRKLRLFIESQSGASAKVKEYYEKMAATTTNVAEIQTEVMNNESMIDELVTELAKARKEFDRATVALQTKRTMIEVLTNQIVVTRDREDRDANGNLLVELNMILD
jgi:hypothetical protein